MLEHAKLELKEETGMEGIDRELYTSYSCRGKVAQYINYYIVRDVKKVTEQSLDPGGELIEVKLLDFDTMIDMVVRWELWDVYFRNDILCMKLEGTLDEFKKRLFG